MHMHKVQLGLMGVLLFLYYCVVLHVVFAPYLCVYALFKHCKITKDAC